MSQINRFRRAELWATAAPLGLMLAATPAFAQKAPPATSAETNPQAQAATTGDEGDIVVTGTLFRRTDTETPSPVTVLSSQTLENRGINTVAEAIQRLSANGAGALPSSFSANGAFASGASAPSLRGLTTDSTLVLFDGLRAAYYPLADDGTRNFVDINSIPDAIIDRIEVLKDGASSTYGADAVAGVINIITKKQFNGLKINASAGLSQHADAPEQRFDAILGFGDLAEKGFNFYIAGEYQHDAALYSRDRGYPYNTNDLSKLCGTSIGSASVQAGTTTCRTNSIANGIQFDGTYAGLSSTNAAVVRAENATNSVALGSYNVLGNCNGLTAINLTTAQRSAITATSSTVGYTGYTYGATQCQQDSRNLYSVISPEQQRIGGSGRLTINLTDALQAYVEGNWYQSKVYYTGTPLAIRANTPSGGVTGTTASIALPVYVCNRNGANASYVNGIPQVAGCNAANGTLNPNNPYAAQGQVARLYYNFGDIPVSNDRLVNSFRGAAGVTGTFGDGWGVSLEGTYMKEKLKAVYKGYPYFQHVLNAIADGSYNFVNPSLNSQAARDYIAPTETSYSDSDLGQVQLSISKDLFNLPGGPLQVAVGGAYRYESVYAPSANSVDATNPYNRYYSLNGFGTSGNRNIESGFFEIHAPVFDKFELDGSGRYDSYSSGQTNFSPKIGGKFNPTRWLAIRSTFSKGFRIPSFAESYGLPTTGYISQAIPSSYTSSAACKNAAGVTYSYCTGTYSLGLTSVGNPNLKPEKSTNFTAGVILQPTNNISFSVDYYNIYKKDLITGAAYSPQLAAYYGNNGSTALVSGITGIQTDPNYIAGQGPYPLLTTIQYGFINADSAKSTGIDFDLEASFHLSPTIKWTSSLDATYVIELSKTIDGVKQSYQDSLGEYQTTAASGTPQWRGSWQNTLDFGKALISLTTYYTAGYSEGAADDGNTPDGQTCSGGSITYYRDGVTPVLCRVHSFIDNDLTVSVKVNEKFTLYTNILNVFNAKPPYDPSTYGAYQYNPAWANAGIIGRYFRVGARATF